MDLIVYNDTSDTALIFYGDRKYSKADLLNYLPGLPKMLSGLRQVPIVDLEYPRHFNRVIAYITTALRVELEYLGRADAAQEVATGVVRLPRWIYAVSFVDPANINIAVDTLEMKAPHSGSVFVQMYETEMSEAKKRVSEIFQLQFGQPTTLLDAQGADVVPFHLMKLPSRRITLDIDKSANQHAINLRVRSSDRDLVIINQAKAYRGLIAIIVVIFIIAVIIAVVISAAMASGYTKSYVPDEVRRVVYQEAA